VANNNKWLACEYCDALLKMRDVGNAETADCPICQSTLLTYKKDSISRTLVFSLTGLLLYFPANLLPVMTLEIIGQKNSNSMVNGVQQLFEQGFWWMGFLVLMCSVLMPLFELSLLLFITLLVKLNWRTRALAIALKCEHLCSEWGMLEVYMLGILVAYIKMRSLGDIVIGPAMWLFILLLISTVAALWTFDRHAVWDFLESDKT